MLGKGVFILFFFYVNGGSLYFRYEFIFEFMVFFILIYFYLVVIGKWGYREVFFKEFCVCV